MNDAITHNIPAKKLIKFVKQREISFHLSVCIYQKLKKALKSMDKSIEEGPLSDQSFILQNDDDEESGLPLQYLLGVQDLEQEQFESRFYRLQVEDTAFSSLESSNPDPAHLDPSRLRLDVSLDDPPKSGGIIFSPCGTQAVVYPIQHSPNVIESKRPATVGQSKEDTPTKQGHGSSSTMANIDDNLVGRKVTSGMQLQVRMEDFKNSLDFATFSQQDVPSSLSSSADPSPRRFRMAPKARERYLLQEPDNFYTSVSEHDLTGESESAVGTPSPLITARSLADRANSPSVASVTSGYSAASSAPGGTARRHLEWDSGADLGYIGEKLVAQKDVAASLSTLEKLAIGNYSNFFRSEPEGKPSTAGQPPPPRLPGPDREEEMRKMRLESYANSLLLQSQRQQANAIQTSAATFVKNSPTRGGTKSNLPDSDGQSVNKSSSPSRRRSLHRPSMAPNTSKFLPQNDRFHSPLRSASLTDLTSLANRRGSDWFTKRQSPTQFRSEPSSSSSTATVVPIQPINEPLENTILRAFTNMDPRSLPPSLQGLLCQDLQQLKNLSELHIEAAQQWQIPGRASLTSLGSRYSQSRSFETVIRAPDSDSLDTEEELQLLRRQPIHPPTDNVQELPSTSRSAWTALSPVRDSSRAQSLPKDANSSEQNNVLTNIWLQKRTSQEPAGTKMVGRIPGQAWTTSNDETDGGLKRSHGTQTQQRDGFGRCGRRSVGTYTGRWSSRTHARSFDRGSSMPATTSEDDLQQLGGASATRPRRRPSYPTNCSTLESAAHIDRAKSFEYIPGESFPLQENSSSYEYLPGHMVDDRPATAISANSVDQKSLKKDLYTSEYITTEDTMSSHSSSSRPKGRGRHHLASTEENITAKELLDKSHDLKSARSKSTKEFYRRLQKYIKFLSEPSQTPEDCRIKQEVASKVLSLIQTEELKLLQSDQSTQENLKQMTSRVSSKESDSEPVVHPGASDTTDRGKRRQHRKKSKVGLYHPTLTAEEAQGHPPQVQSLQALIIGTNLPDDIEVQRMRIEQMRRLRKELRTLEKLERLRLNKAVGGPLSVDEHLIKQLNDNSFDSVSTNLTEISTTGRLNIEGQSASDTWTQSAPQTTPSTQKIKSGASHKPESLLRDPVPPKRSSSRQSEKPSPKRAPGASRKSIKKFTIDKNQGQVEFGQTFPSPRPTTTEVLTIKANVNLQITQPDKKVVEESKKLENRVFTIKRNPIAYYLPLSNQNPIVIGKRILRERGPEAHLGKENRNILANYMSALNLGSKPIIRKPPQPKEQVGFKEVTLQKVSLQDALAECRPDLLRQFQERTRKLHEMKAMRLEYEADMRKWISANETLAEADRTPKPLPPCLEKKIPHLFNYKDMVVETRKKYESLPEVRRQRLEARRRSAYRTNRLMANVFKRKLKMKVLKGRVSHAHSSRVI